MHGIVTESSPPIGETDGEKGDLVVECREGRLLVTLDDGDLLVEESLLVGHRLEHAWEDFIEELLLGGDDDIDLRMKCAVLARGRLCLQVGDDFWCPYLPAEDEDSANLLVLTADVLERVVDLLIGRAACTLVLALDVDVRRSINRNGDGRTGVEVIITNGYENRIEK